MKESGIRKTESSGVFSIRRIFSETSLVDLGILSLSTAY